MPISKLLCDTIGPDAPGCDCECCQEVRLITAKLDKFVCDHEEGREKERPGICSWDHVFQIAISRLTMAGMAPQDFMGMMMSIYNKTRKFNAGQMKGGVN